MVKFYYISYFSTQLPTKCDSVLLYNKEPDTTEYSHARTHTHTDSIYYYMFETWLCYAKLKKPVAKLILMIPFSSSVQNQ